MENQGLKIRGRGDRGFWSLGNPEKNIGNLSAIPWA